MADARALLRLATWLSPAFPTGGFAWSGGLEAACAAGTVRDAAGLRARCETLLHHGGLRADAVALAAVHAGEDADRMDALLRALAVSPERLAETVEQGEAFAAAAAPWFEAPLPPHVLPVVVGTATRRAGIDRAAAVVAFVNAALTQQVQAAQRLAPIGQATATQVLAALEQEMLSVAEAIAAGAPREPASFTPTKDIAAMGHGALPSRIFRS